MIVPSRKQKRSLEEAAATYRHQLLEDAEALKYLIQERQFTKEALDYFQLGVVREPVHGHERFLNRISFPYITTTGITSIRFRTLDPGDKKKFLSIPGDTARLYNITTLINNDNIFVTEGETDTIACWMAGIPAVGVPGATNWKPVFSRVLMNRYVTVLADNDDRGQGQEFAYKVRQHLEDCDIIMMPQGYDVSSFISSHGLDALREMIHYEHET